MRTVKSVCIALCCFCSRSLWLTFRCLFSYYPPFASIAKGEVFVLLYVCFFVFFCLFGQRFLSNTRADSRHILHAGVAWVGTCLLPFWGLAAPGGRKKEEMKFLLLWVNGCQWGIFAFWRFLSDISVTRARIHTKYYLCTDNVCRRAPSPCGIHRPLGAGGGGVKN